MGFIKGRNILKSIAIAQEVIQFTKRNKTSGFMLKLDFKKAHDMVDWECILEALQSFASCRHGSPGLLCAPLHEGLNTSKWNPREGHSL